MKEKISPADLKELLQLTGGIAKLQVKYIDRGFGPQEIAGTFASCYSRQFERALTPEIAAKISRASYQQSSSSSSNAIVSYFLILCSEIVKVTTKRVRDHR